MTFILRAPLLPAATCGATIALVSRASVSLALVCAALAAAATLALAIASADRSRALLWVAAGTTSVALGLRLLVGAPDLDVSHLGPLDALRAELARPLQRLVAEPESGILLGIVLGQRASVSPDLAYAFAATGTTHLLAISGFNMTLVATAVALTLRRRAPLARAIATVVAVATYSVLVGLAPSVLRAALMSSVAALGLASGRRAATANALCAAVAAMLLADPEAIADLGFLLSASATAGLVLWQAPLASRAPLLPGLIREGLATTLAATAPTLPIVAAAFGRVSLVSPLANLVAVPLFPPLMLAGAATSAIGVLSLDLAQPVALLAYACAFVLRAVVETFAALPLASLSVPAGPLTGLAVAIAETAAVAGARAVHGWAAGLASESRARGPAVIAMMRTAAGPFSSERSLPPTRLTIASAMIVTLVVGGAIAWPSADPPVRIRALDVGQGDAYLVEIDGMTLLVDGGPDPARLVEELGASLPPWRRRIDLIALTHAHLDHGAGLLAVVERFEVGLAIEPAGLSAGPLADMWSERLAKANVVRRAVHAGQQLRLGGATLTVLAPNDDPAVDLPNLVLRLERRPFSALFTGDATDQALADLLLRPDDLRARLYVPPHHGAQTPYANAMVQAVRPEAALISAGAGNRYGHPTPETLAALQGIATYRTDRDGTVEISLDGSSIVVRTHANGLPPPRRGSVPYAPARR